VNPPQPPVAISSAAPPAAASSAVPPAAAGNSTLRARRAGIHTQQEAVVFIRSDSPVCRSEGLMTHSRVLLVAKGRRILATLYQASTSTLEPHEAALSDIAWERLGVAEGDLVSVAHADPVESLAMVRRRIYGHRLDQPALAAVIGDIVAGRYSDVDLAAFITACAALPLDEAETVALTRVMVDVGDHLAWPDGPILDKHSVGGLPGNRTTPIVVAIVAALGLTMPKTSSRAITSPAGTADTMETLAPVDLDLATIRRVVEREHGCIVWGGSVRLSPADDIMIRIERALDLDSEGQLVASVLSKKIAAGATHLVLDMPVGPTAKVRGDAAAAALSRRLGEVAETFGLRAVVLLTDGSQPVGRGIGPALEARDVLAVLQGEAEAPADLRQRSTALAGALLELGGAAAIGAGAALAERTLAEGRAWCKFQRICEAQGGMRVPPWASERRPLAAPRSGVISAIDNRRVARLAKLAGAPEAKAAGLELHARRGDRVEKGAPLCTLHAESPGELHYALDYAAANLDMFAIEAE
jgi:thymidine phosphorylase